MGIDLAEKAQRPKTARCVQFALGLLALLGMIALHVPAAEISMTEHQIKALCILNFTKYVEWPSGTFAGAQAPIRIGVAGDKKVFEMLRAAGAGKLIGTHPVEISDIAEEEDASACQVLFIGASERRSHHFLDVVKNQNILTVGETEVFADAGGIITFTKKENKVRFEVNLTAARQAGLQISSKMLSLADAVRGRE